MKYSRYVLPVSELPLSERARQVIDSLVQEARAAIHSGDEQEHQFLLCNSSNETILVIRPHEFPNDQGMKDRFVADIRRQAHTMEADMVIMLAEGWQPPDDVTREEYAALRQRFGAIANMPGALETLIVRIETPGQVLASVARISGKGSTRRCEPVLFASMTDVEIENEKGANFSQLLPTAEQIAIVNETLARAEKMFIARGVNPHQKVFHRSLMQSMELLLWTVPGLRVPDRRLEIAVQAALHIAGK